ncbi:MAG: hypothetical protein KatS3mg076_1667 [Candidatus Binatia bacterium]|nr:MAG: hypothetical protein KatS3mg076_1667 [Candidatus Binatia bacterium]
MAKARKPSNLAGRWYPADPRKLREELERCLRDAEEAELSALEAAVVPHAAYRYSGKAAAGVYRIVGDTAVERVVLLAPSHYCAYLGVAVPTFEVFETPLGEVGIETDSVEALRGNPLVAADDFPYEREHSLEIQLPFLQVVAPGVPVVPLMVGELRRADASRLASSLVPLRTPGTIFLASSDFTHYGADFDYLPFPPLDEDYVRKELARLDRGAVEFVLRADPSGFRRYVEETGATVCGRRPIEVLLELEAGRVEGVLVDYYTSLDVTGDYEHSVSYAAIAFPPPAA